MLKAILKELGWTQAKLARKLGVHVNTVFEWRDNLPEYAKAYLEAALGVKRLWEEVDRDPGEDRRRWNRPPEGGNKGGKYHNPGRRERGVGDVD